jgi:hypothetical protein
MRAVTGAARVARSVGDEAVRRLAGR